MLLFPKEIDFRGNEEKEIVQVAPRALVSLNSISFKTVCSYLLQLKIEPISGTAIQLKLRIQMNGVITSESLLESFQGHNVSCENKFIPIWWTETSAGIDEETAKEFNSKVLKVLCWLEDVTSWIFCDVFKHHKRLKSLRAKCAKLLFLIIKYANF